MAQIQAYKDHKALSQSSLKLLDYDPKSFYFNEERWLKGEISVKSEFKVTESMRLGEVVDCLLLTPQDFDSHFVINTAVSPSGQMATFTDEYIRLEKEASDNYSKPLEKEIVQQIAQKAYEYAGFKRDSFTKVLDRFKDEALPYYNVHRKAGGRALITAEMYKHAQDLVKALKEDVYAKDYLALGDYPWQEIHNQVHVTSKFVQGQLEVPLKGLIDRIVVDHSKKTIQPIDLKTTSEDFFPSSIVSYRYDMQAAFYISMLGPWRYQNKLVDYEILPFLFITINTTNSKVIVWELSDQDLHVGSVGGRTLAGKQLKGFTTLLRNYCWHKEENKWDYPREVYENEGKRITNCFVNA